MTILDLRHTFCADCDVQPISTGTSAVKSFAEHELTVIKHLWGNMQSLVGGASRQWVRFSRRQFNAVWERTATALAVSREDIYVATNQHGYENEASTVVGPEVADSSSSPLLNDDPST